MSPRRYEMGGRKAAVEATRKRIVAAAVRLHSRRGAMRTAWDEIAAEAGVSRATVYHHFPSLDDLVPACAQVAFDLIEVPSPAAASDRFAKLDSPSERVEVFVRESCRCYAAGAGWLRAAWRERELVPSMGSAVRRLQRALGVLLDAAVDGARVRPEERRVLVALVDFPFWSALDEAGIPRDRIADRILELVAATIDWRKVR
ncbi:MAG: TetR/AcrR family transcriptional regulator [Chloroflexi bacterium]|nr:MAG: TetR/AcrR family transcriptional regulator [Chloroflexota bacterium]